MSVRGLTFDRICERRKTSAAHCAFKTALFLRSQRLKENVLQSGANSLLKVRAVVESSSEWANNYSKSLPIERLDLAFYLDHQGISLPIQRLSSRDLDPSLADAIFIDIGSLFIVELDANVVFENGCVVIRAAWID
jgi:hypothetical protein